MIILINACALWLLGSAFGYGFSHGSLSELGNGLNGGMHPTLWPVWPAYLLGRTLGQRWMAHKLAPQRMKEKLMEAQRQAFEFGTSGVIYGTSSTITQHGTWTPNPSHFGGNTP